MEEIGGLTDLEVRLAWRRAKPRLAARVLSREGETVRVGLRPLGLPLGASEDVVTAEVWRGPDGNPRVKKIVSLE